MKKFYKLLAHLLKNKQSWAELKVELSKYNVDDIQSGKKDTSAGKIFEVFAKHYFLNAPELENHYKNVWLDIEIPDKVKESLSLVKIEHGLDILLETVEGKFLAVQCKFKNDETSKLRWTSDKIANLFGYCPKADGYIVFSNASMLDGVSLTRSENFTFFNVGHLLEIDTFTIDKIYRSLDNQKPQKRELYKPKLHQQQAIDQCVLQFKRGATRGQLILPCGAGKTYTSLWIKEKLNSKNTLVLVPSLALLRQIKNEWSKQKRSQYKYICVCSEKDIDKNNHDSTITHTYEIGGNVTTDSSEIRSFILSSKNIEKVVFSTYHSLPSIVEAITNLDFKFDFVFCDEAHRTAGIKKGVFGIIHDNKKVPAKRRLYATATPRIVRESLKKKLGDDLQYTYDMNDSETFGEEFFRMSFKEAIEAGVLVDYKIIAIGVGDKELSKYLKERRYINKNESIDEIANNYALEYVMEKYAPTHALTFHSRVKYAETFSKRHGDLFNTVDTFSVSGKQPTSKRKLILNKFALSNKTVISNARCLTEGVDVPSIDLVYFSDPKNSKIDIIQAVGRALRTKPQKKIGYVVVPIYHKQNNELDSAISKSTFKNLIQVIRSLCEQDERLQDEINQLALGKGKRKSQKIDIISISEIFTLIGFEDKLKAVLFDQIIDKTSNSWDVWFLKFKEYYELSNKSVGIEDEELSRWASQQRSKKRRGSLGEREIKKLDSICFIWEVDDWKWDQMYLKLLEYAQNNKYKPLIKNNYRLASWYYIQQNLIVDGSLRSDRKTRFEKISLINPSQDDKWEPRFKDLINFKIENPDRWPIYDPTNKHSRENSLNIFCELLKGKFKKKTLSDYWYNNMIELGFQFEPKEYEWSEKLKEVSKIITEENSFLKEDIGMHNFNWLISNKKNYITKRLISSRENLFANLIINKIDIVWTTYYNELKAWKNKNRILPNKDENSKLFNWLKKQESLYNNWILDKKHKIKLEEIGYFLNQKTDTHNWMIKYNLLCEFKKLNPDVWPQRIGPDSDIELYNWCLKMTKGFPEIGSIRENTILAQWKVDKLNEINFSLAKNYFKQEEWDSFFSNIPNYINDSFEVDIPRKIGTKINPLYKWWERQKRAYKNNKLSDVKIKKLQSINIDQILKDKNTESWENNFQRFKTILDENGIPKIEYTIDGKLNPLSIWFSNQRKAFNRGYMDKERAEAFQKIGIELKVISGFSYLRWKSNIITIAEFNKEKGRYPSPNGSRYEKRLYKYIEKTKFFRDQGDLSKNHYKVLKKFGINLDEI